MKAQKSWAKARPWHHHQDLFGEEDLLGGFKLGPELTGYTPIQTSYGVENVQSALRFVGGASLEFIYNVPRVEVDLFWNARGGINTSESYHAIAIPLLLKIPLQIDTNTDLEFGAGFEPDGVLFGVDPHRSWMYGALGSIGVLDDFKDYLFDFELRYNYGLQDIADSVNGAKPRDFQVLLGILWHL